MAVPPKLKAIQPYLKLATEHDKRDGVVAYYCKMFAVQKGISIDSKSPDCKGFLLKLMDSLEQMKKTLSTSGNEAITNDLVGCAHVESKALALFSWADAEDRKANFSSGVVRAFYSANLLFETLKQFGTQSDEVIVKQKYAKWKATYINKCLQSGETPLPGPQGSEFEGDMGKYQDAAEGDTSLPYPPSSGNPMFPPSFPSHSPSDYPSHPPSGGNVNKSQEPYTTPHEKHEKPQASGSTKKSQDTSSSYDNSLSSASTSYSVPVDYTQATKLCKYAISALQYEDVSTAVSNLEKALELLRR